MTLRSLSRTCYLVILIGALTLLAARMPVAGAQAGWTFPDRTYRIPISVQANGYARSDKPAEIRLNFTSALAGLGESGAFDPNSIRVAEVTDDGAVLDDNVVFQFDQDTDYDAATKASGTLVFLLKGDTAATATRRFDVYFDKAGAAFTPPVFQSRIDVGQVDNYEGQASFQITTRDAANAVYSQYYYQKQGAAFASWFDKDHNDWISYHPDAGSQSSGEYRGIPNAGAVFHPGFSNTYPSGQGNNPNQPRGGPKQGSQSVIRHQGPLKVTIFSRSSNTDWEATWEIYPTYARMSLLKKPDQADAKYWFLYEGTPGGELNNQTNPRDFVVRNQIDSGQPTIFTGTANTSWTNDLGPVEWVFFADGQINRSLFMVHHEDDEIIDSYRPQNNFGSDESKAMTVFGFGRSGSNQLLTQANQHFTMGLVDSRSAPDVVKAIDAAYRDLIVNAGAAEKYASAPPNTPPAAANDTAATRQNTPVTIAVLANDSDPDGDPLTVSVTGVTSGTAVVNPDQTITFTPAPGFSGQVTVTYTVSDGRGGTATASVTIEVRPVDPANKPPVAANDTAATRQNTPVTIAVLANDSDPDGDALAIAGVTQPISGTAQPQPDGTVTYTPAPGFSGIASFTYTVSDGRSGTATASVTVTVSASPSAPPVHRTYLPLALN